MIYETRPLWRKESDHINIFLTLEAASPRSAVPVLSGKPKVRGSMMTGSSGAVDIRSKESVHFRHDKV